MYGYCFLYIKFSTNWDIISFALKKKTSNWRGTSKEPFSPEKGPEIMRNPRDKKAKKA